MKMIHFVIGTSEPEYARNGRNMDLWGSMGPKTAEKTDHPNMFMAHVILFCCQSYNSLSFGTQQVRRRRRTACLAPCHAGCELSAPHSVDVYLLLG